MFVKARMKMLVLTIVLILSSRTESFLLEENCLAGPPCQCSNNFLYCNGEGLSQLPTFLPVHKTVPYLLIDLRGNYLRILEANGFQVLQTMDATSIELNLADNDIEIIDDEAFAGIEKSIRNLYLDNNYLEYLPPALGKLINLSDLWLERNRLKLFDPAVFAGFGSSLKSLDFSIDTMTEWPTEALNNLQKLDQLYVYDTQVVNWTIPQNALDGVKNSLTSLSYDVDEADFTDGRLPASFCALSRLRKLRIYLSYWVYTGNVLFDNCNTIMSSMESLQLYYFSNLNVTKIFTIFPSLTHLNLDSNDLRDFRLREYHTGSLKVLRLEDNAFPYIPSDVNKLVSLESLSLAYNEIKYVGDYYINALVNLDFLDLSHNMISHISSIAFASNQKLRSLNLEVNLLKTLPTSVTQLPALSIFFISLYNDKQFVCSCQAMANVTSWKVDSIIFPNKCNATGVGMLMPMKTYIQNNLSACP